MNYDLNVSVDQVIEGDFGSLEEGGREEATLYVYWGRLRDIKSEEGSRRVSGSLITAIMEITNTIRMLCVLIPHVLDYDVHVLHCLLIVVVDTRKLPHPISLTSYVGFVPCTFYCNEFIFYVSL